MRIKQKIKDLIEKHQTIIIHRHLKPDMDAIGSQYGLYLLLRENYPNKDIYVVGDLNDMSYQAKMHVLNDNQYKGALVIITDVSVKRLISDDRYHLADQLVIIDHHQNETDLEKIDLFYRDASYASACEMIIDLAKTFKYLITPEAATYLYGGMVTDTGRFLYLNEASKTFELAAYITRFNPNIQGFYNYLYTESLAKRKTKNLFNSFEVTKYGVAYRKNTHELIIQSGLEFQAISRGMVNQMAGIKEIPIWASFTEDHENHTVVAELRSRGITIVDIAKKYGGGGHNQACGATLNSWEEIENVVKDLDERARTHAKNTE